MTQVPPGHLIDINQNDKQHGYRLSMVQRLYRWGFLHYQQSRPILFQRQVSKWLLMG